MITHEELEKYFNSEEERLIRDKFGRIGFSNYYTDLSDLMDAFEKKRAFKITGERSVYVLLDEGGFFRMYYFRDDNAEAEGDLLSKSGIDLHGKPVVCEFITRGDAGTEGAILEKMNFRWYKTYCKIQNLPPRKHFKERIRIEYGGHELVDEIYEMMHEAFDELSDHLPSKEALHEYADAKGIYAAYLQDELAGIYLYHDVNNRSVGDSICVKEKFRNSLVGYSLLARFINDHHDFKVIEGWIEEGLEQAIRLNAMFGSKVVRDRDYVYIYQNT